MERISHRYSLNIKEIPIRYGELSLDISAQYTYHEGKPLLICLHGLGCSKESFEGIWDYPQSSDYSIFLPDFIGFGNSSIYQISFKS